MPQIHIKLPTDVHSKLLKKAKEFNVSIQEFTEQTIGIAAEAGLAKMYTLRKKAPKKDSQFNFIDLFAGIGGTRLAFERAGGRCVFTSEWDRFSQRTYLANFGDMPEGDITKIPPETIHDHNVLVGGFPCQPFSIAGVSKKNSLGREHGFKDKTQGTLFFNIANILDKKQPEMFLLENVKNLRSHDKGNTFKVITGTLTELGYKVFDQTIDAQSYVPQHRERIFLVGFRKSVFGDSPHFSYPTPPKTSPKLKSILQKKVDDKYMALQTLCGYFLLTETITACVSH